MFAAKHLKHFLKTMKKIGLCLKNGEFLLHSFCAVLCKDRNTIAYLSSIHHDLAVVSSCVHFLRGIARMAVISV